MFAKLLAKIAKTLESFDIGYMIIGGQAVLAYGEPRLTRDIDVTLSVDVDQVPQMLQIIKNIGLIIQVKSVKSFVEKTRVLPTISKRSGIRVDFIFSNTPYERKAIRRARKIKINGQDVRYATVEDVIIHKIFAGRPKDIEDIAGIISKQSKIDIRYIHRWLKRFQEGMGISYVLTFDKLITKYRKSLRNNI